MTRFTGRVAVVTAAGAGIGRAIALALLDEGAALVANDVAPSGLAELRARAPDRVAAVEGAVEDATTPARLVAAAETVGERIDALFNNAGVSHMDDAEHFDLSAWRRVVEVNLVAMFGVAQAIGRQMIAQRGGAIVNVASTAGLTGMPRNSAYVASKHGVVGLTRALAVEWARYGIRVNAICPGLTATDTVARLETEQPELIAARRAGALLGRLADPAEQAQVALFLASDDAGYVNGLVANVDGGNMALGAGYPPPGPAEPGPGRTRLC